MSEKDLKINFRYLTGNIACMSVDSIDGKPVHNDINDEEAIIIFNSLVGEKENCKTVKTLLQENKQYKEVIDKAVDIAYEYGQIDGNHHKLWVIDQMLRILLNEKYQDFIKDYEEDGKYTWDTGIAP